MPDNHFGKERSHRFRRSDTSELGKGNELAGHAHCHVNARVQRGGAVVEYVVVLLALIVLWHGIGFVMNRLSEHQDEYIWAIGQPY